MKKLLNILSTLALMLSTITSIIGYGNEEKPHTIENFYVLGDSLSDVGAFTGAGSLFFQNIPLMTKHNLELTLPYYQNRSFTNGQAGAELVSKKLNQKSQPGWDFYSINLKHFSQVGNNYAFGGALANNISFWSAEGLFLNNFSLTNQVTALLKQHTFKNNDLVYINIGSNDLMRIINENIPNPDQNIKNIINVINTNLIKLIEAKNQHLVITNISNLGLIPTYKETAKQIEITNLVNKYNNELKNTIEKLTLQFPHNIIKEYDIFSEFNKLLQIFTSRGKQYKLSNATTLDFDNIVRTTGICQPQYVLGANPKNIDNYFFIDQVHPTKWVHEKVADDLYNFLITKF